MGWVRGIVCSGLLVLVSVAHLGWRPAISPGVRQAAFPPIPFAELRADPSLFKGRTAILGGTILHTTNEAEHTRIEVLQKRLDRLNAPIPGDETGGRFMARCKGYLDPAIFAKGRQVTIAGNVVGSYDGEVGEAAYVYPFLSCIETHLWPRSPAPDTYHDPYPWLAPYYPFYRHPFHRHRHYRRRH